MTLVPYTVTALAESDAEGTDGKNIVVGAVVTLTDTNGNAVDMYDDEVGSSPNTAKVTGSNGQVIIYIEEGEYTLSVNGSESKIITGKKRLSTTQDLIGSTRPYRVGDVVTTLGFSIAGDGGAAQWRATGNTITASQSPADLGDAKLSDALGNEFVLVDIVYKDLEVTLNISQSIAKTIMNSAIYQDLVAASIRISNDTATPDATTNTVFIRDKASVSSQATTLQVQRDADAVTAANPKAIRAITTIASGIDSVEYAISAELTNNSDAVNGGASASSAVALKNGVGNTFGGHFQVKDTQGTISSVGGSMIGQELNIQANGVDDSEVRIGYDIIARTYAPNFPAQPAGEFHAGVRIRNSSLGVEGGKWNHALIVEDGVQATPKAITVKNSPGTSTGYSYKDEGSKASGFWATGNYGQAAVDLEDVNISSNDVLIKLKDKGKVELASGVQMKWDSGLAGANGSLSFTGMTTQTTVGAAGAAAPLPANPSSYLSLTINGNDFVVPLYLRA